MKEECLEYSALLAISTKIKKANKYKQYNCMKYWRSDQVLLVILGHSKFICTLSNAILMRKKRLFHTLNHLSALDFSNARTRLFVRMVRAAGIT